MSYALSITFLLLGCMWLLWVFFLACMNLKRAKEAGTLSKWALIFGTPVLWVGYLLDAFCNITLMTVVLLEMPRLKQGEWLVTDRLIRHHKESQGWRLSVVKFMEPLLDPFDPSGDHV